MDPLVVLAHRDLHGAPIPVNCPGVAQRVRRSIGLGAGKVLDERARRGQILECVLEQPGARRELVEIVKKSLGRRRPRRFDDRRLQALALFLSEPADDVEPKPRRALLIDETPKFARVHLDRFHADAVTARVVHEHLRRVEPHRLHVEDRG